MQRPLSNMEFSLDRYFATLLAATLITITSHASAGGWVADGKSGCNLWHKNPQFSHTVSYEGGCESGKAAGHGKAVWQYDGKPSDRYEGMYADGKRNGRGKLHYAWGLIYDGEWKDGLRHGQGIEEMVLGKTKIRFEGAFLNDSRHGFGI